MWTWDDGATWACPGCGIEAVADQWDTHDIQINLAFGDGRVLERVRPRGGARPLGADGQPRVLGAGPLSFELVEPFGWRARIDGAALETSARSQIDG